jgi:hypothetical protein
LRSDGSPVTFRLDGTGLDVHGMQHRQGQVAALGEQAGQEG